MNSRRRLISMVGSLRRSRPDVRSGDQDGPDLVSGFGYKTAWLAFRGSTQQQVVTALGLATVTSQDWQTAIRESYADNPAVAVTPPFHGTGGNWVMATSIALLLTEPDVAALSKKTGTEVQYFVSERISETHGWAKAVDGRLIRSFQWSGHAAALVTWVGRPDSAEQGFGLPDVASATQATSDAVFDADIDEESVMTLAGHWSVNPQTIDGTPSPGSPLVGAMP